MVALLDLPRWTEHLHALPGWREGDRASTMLLRQPPVRVLLSALRSDAEVGSDGAQETLMLLVLSGAASIEWRGEVARIGQGELAVVPAGGGWRVTSEADETLLLSTFWGTPGTGVRPTRRPDEAAAASSVAASGARRGWHVPGAVPRRSRWRRSSGQSPSPRRRQHRRASGDLAAPDGLRVRLRAAPIPMRRCRRAASRRCRHASSDGSCDEPGEQRMPLQRPDRRR